MSRLRRPHRLAGIALAAASSVLALQAAAPASAVAPGPGTLRRPSPIAAARAAGVEPGNATMGWPADRSPALASDSAGKVSAKAFVPSGVLGIDVSSHQGRVNWSTYARQGKRFAYVKATEGTYYKNPYFRSQYTGSSDAGLIRGAYHFANPRRSSGKAQATYFVRNGGGWTADGRTLPGVLDIEYNPYAGGTCYGLTKKQMVAWVASFLAEYKRRTSRDAVIYTTTDWWTRCTGNSTRFSATNPLWAARYGTRTPGTLPGGWRWATFWQYSSIPIDQNRFSSSYNRLVVLATKAS